MVLEPLPYTIYWHHRVFWRCKFRFLTRDSVHLNSRGNYKFFRSVRGAVLDVCAFSLLVDFVYIFGLKAVLLLSLNCQFHLIVLCQAGGFD